MIAMFAYSSAHSKIYQKTFAPKRYAIIDGNNVFEYTYIFYLNSNAEIDAMFESYRKLYPDAILLGTGKTYDIDKFI